jgi:signal transduction histidine kinase/ligand-binding sensor domain-containing protein
MRKLLFAILLFIGAYVHAQPKKPYFNTLNVSTGLPEEFVQSSLEDRYGYLWLGTQNGLVRYDGYNLKPYPIPDDEGNAIVNIAARYLFEDRQGKIFLQARGEGFYYLDRKSDSFKKYKWSTPAQDSLAAKASAVFFCADNKQSTAYWIGIQQFNDTIPFKIFYFDTEANTLKEFSPIGKGKYYIPARQTIDLRQDANGKIWLVANNTLSYFDTTSKSFVTWFELPENKHGDLFETFYPDPADPDVLWMNTYDPNTAGNPALPRHVMRVLQFNTKTKKYKSFVPDPTLPGALPASGIQIFTDSLKRIWVSTEKGISLFNRQTGTFTNYPLSFPFVAGTSVIAADKEGNLWMAGNAFTGLYYLDVKSAVVTPFISKGEPGDLPLNATANRLFFDRSGTLWVSNPFAGISYVDRQKTLFAASFVYLQPRPLPANGKPAPFRIVGFAGDSICYIRDSAGLFAWFSTTNTYAKIELKEKEADKNVSNVVRAPDGNLWIASYGKGLYNYNPQTKSAINFTPASADSLLLNKVISEMVVDRQGILWIGTSNQGLCSFNKQTRVFRKYPFIVNNGTKKAGNELDDVSVLSLLMDTEGILWIGTNLGALNRFDSKTGQFTSYLDRKKGFNCVVSILEDSKKRLWAGTYLGGLFLFDRNAGTFKRYSVQDGLLNNDTRFVTEDAEGNIWSMNAMGMSRLNPVSNAITNYTALKLRQRNFDLYKDAQGNFHIATRDGFISFNPLKLNDNKIPPAMLIESISYRSAGADADTVVYAEGLDEITLAHNQNKIAFHFVALHFANAEKNQYQYQLTGYDKDWVIAGKERNAIYTNLSPGSYTFKVKGANSDGVWNEKESVLNIVILPPWWQTWWAYVLYALLIGGAIWSYIQYRSKALRVENQLLEEKVNHRTKELQQSLSDLKSTQTKLIQSEKMASLGELTAGIAHEIQNPLNFVNNFSEVNNELIDELNEELDKGNISEAKFISSDIKHNLEKITHHGKRADAIVKGMLQHSRTAGVTKEPTDINKLADEYLRLAYHGLRAKDNSFNATLNTDFDEQITKINIIPQDIGRVILNLITNAFYAVDEKKKSLAASAHETSYEPTVSISTKRIGSNKVEISIADNGNGIPEAIKEKIFQPFFTTKPTGKGTGLGLSLSYDIVKAHGGEISIKSTEGVGSEFIIVLKAEV